jgi:hypothetical protein
MRCGFVSDGAEEEHREMFPAAAEAIKSLTETNQRVVLLRLAAKYNNGDAHFDHSPGGYSWLCLKCALDALGLPPRGKVR